VLHLLSKCVIIHPERMCLPMTIRTLLKMFIIYFIISLFTLVSNFFRLLKTLNIHRKYKQNILYGNPQSNKDFEHSIKSLSAKANLSYYSYLRTHNVLRTLSDHHYFNKYQSFFSDVESRFRQKIKLFLSWPSFSASFLSDKLFQKQHHKTNVILRILIWLFLFLIAYVLENFMDFYFKDSLIDFFKNHLPPTLLQLL